MTDPITRVDVSTERRGMDPFPRAGHCPTCGRYCFDTLWCVRCYLFGEGLRSHEDGYGTDPWPGVTP